MQSVVTRTFCNTCLRRFQSNQTLLNDAVSKSVLQNPVNIRWFHRTFQRAVESKKTPPHIGSKIKKPGQGPVNPLNWRTMTGLIGFGIGFYAYIQYLKGEAVTGMKDYEQRAYGQAEVGGDWELVNHDGKLMTNKDLLGNWVLIYFGFTHCPDICPDELEKMVKVVNIIDENPKLPNIIPLFITVDPSRDTVKAMKSYIEEFSDKIIGLTGTQEQVDKACKAYRVYCSKGPKDEDNDYLVDHTIIMYLVDPEGTFKDYYGKNKDFLHVSKSVEIFMQTYQYMKDRKD